MIFDECGVGGCDNLIAEAFLMMRRMPIVRMNMCEAESLVSRMQATRDIVFFNVLVLLLTKGHIL